MKGFFCPIQLYIHSILSEYDVFFLHVFLFCGRVLVEKFTYILLKLMLNVSKYTIPMDPIGYCFFFNVFFIQGPLPPGCQSMMFGGVQSHPVQSSVSASQDL